ncbi:MAG: DNA repair protein RecN [Deltaproteobacteria bacterium]|nr:MAG: DNA repair protein RecN [Deltaproteobacteria bacterium]
MLVQLTISNFAIISNLEIDFKPGLNILSGETGAGKSIIINAVNLILGGRASADLIRSGSNEARVEALFSLPENPSLSELLSDFGLPFHGELLIKRTISREGRNRIMINDSMATLQMLSKLGVMLISISGQHEHQLLLRPDNHLYLLDDFGGLSDERLKLNESFSQHEALKEVLHRLEKEIKESEERQELTKFQMKEIETASIREGEDRLLEEEKKRLRYAEQLMEVITESYQLLYEKGDSVLSEISLCIKRVEKGAEVDKRLGGIKDALASAKVELEEAALELRDLQKTVTIDPSRLEEVEERLQLLNRLKRKYGPSLEDVMGFKDKLSMMVDNLDQKRTELEGINKKLNAMEKDITSKATVLSRKRKRVAKKLEKSVKNEMSLLDMGGTRFEVRFHQGSMGQEDDSENRMRAIKADGYDKVEFMLSPNVGEELRPLSRIASGGELSRIMLAMKTILARTASVETLIFDEVDSGIGGGTAEVVGEKLQSLADYHQILCITHLPQIASKGYTHFLVKKRIKDKRTQTIISELDSEERIEEIARLLGGKVVTQQAIAHAREMMR